MPIRFRCPKCQALMQVADEAAGQRTECPSCQAICSVPQNSPQQAPSADQPKKPPAATGSSGVSPTKRPSGETKQPSPRPAPQAGAGGSPRPASSTQSSIIQVRCPSCQQLMRAAPGTMVKCPHCSATVRTPGGTRPAGPASRPSSPVGDPAFSDDSLFPQNASLPNYSSGPGYSAPARPKQPAYHQPASGSFNNPYAATGYGGGGYAASQPGDRGWQFVTLGVVFILMSILLFLGMISNLVTGVLNLVNGAPQPFEGAHILSIVLAFVISLPLGIVYLLGGISFVRRTGLSAAKTVAVVACIPCFNCFVLTPFGIWAVVLAFGSNSRADFDG